MVDLIEGETISVIARDVVGTVKRFTNVANTQLVATDLNKLLEAGDIVTGDSSNATVTITSVESEPLKAAALVLTPNPSIAEPDDEFGFSESVTEYPDTL